MNASKNGLIMMKPEIATTNNNMISGIKEITQMEKDNLKNEENLDSE
jgi:hypothetical protein